MKKIITCLALSLGFCILAQSAILAQTIITSPIDSRPISIEYLENLAAIGGDDFICVDKENCLDYYSSANDEDSKGDSEKVRNELREIISQNNTKESTVILNTSTYLNGGLVASRSGINYENLNKSLDDLYSLLKDYPEPTYYINLAMPRTLPETRLNNVWKDNEKVEGLGYYYLKYNSDTALREHIYNNLRKVTPSQYLLEYGYIENKKYEMGEDALELWEKEFLENFNKDVNKFPYKTNTYNYTRPYQSVSLIFTKLLKWQDEGLIDEIVISNDDFQLPDFIIYLYNNSDENIPTEDGSPIKFSFARRYMSNGPASLTKLLESNRGKDETKKALEGKSDNVNFIFGLDELSQLIYARDLSKRTDLTTKFNLISSDNANEIAKFDVIGINDLLENAVNFVSASGNKTEKQSDLYLYNYTYANSKKLDATISNIKKSINSGNNTALIEIYSVELLNTGANLLFQTLLEEDTIAKLSAYSAWNTNANAIGLGVAHAQVYGISEQVTEDEEEFQKAHLKMLAQHLIEDGIYTIQIKRALSNERYIPTEEDMIYSQKLYDTLAPYVITDMINQACPEFEITTKTVSFPWRRTFECFLDFDVKGCRDATAFRPV